MTTHYAWECDECLAYGDSLTVEVMHRNATGHMTSSTTYTEGEDQ